MKTSLPFLLLLLLSAATMIPFSNGADRDRFNYGDTRQRAGTNFMDFGPDEWDMLSCSKSSDGTVQHCLGFPDTWELGRDWDIDRNSCIWCPDDGFDRPECVKHHQSPINLQRNRGIENHTSENECIDDHWMKYEDSSCTWEHLISTDSFTIERHALRVSQPLDEIPDDAGNLRLDCVKSGLGRKWGRIDFSEGFSHWWFLSHIDFHVPSEHTMEGHRFSAEAQMYHYYSKSGKQAGIDNEVCTYVIWTSKERIYQFPIHDANIL